MEDIDEAALDFGLLVATASGDRRFIEKVNVDNQVTKLLMEESSWRGTQVMVQSKLYNLPSLIERTEAERAGYEADLKQRVSTKGKHFSIDLLIGGKAQTLTQRTPAGYALQEIADRLAEGKVSAEERVGSFAEFELWAKQISTLQTQFVLRGSQDYVSVVRDTPKGTLSALENALGEIDDRIKQCDQTIERMQTEIETLTPMTILRTIFGGGGRQKSYRTDRVLIRTNKHKFDSRMEIVQSLLKKVGIFANRKFKD